MAENDLAMKFLDSARAELVERIKLRDQALQFYIAATGAYFAFLVTRHFGEDQNELLNVILCFPIPFLCLICTLIVLQHHNLIADLAYYIEKDLSFEGRAKPWNQSLTFKVTHRLGRELRFWAQILVLTVPAGYVVLYGIFTLHPSVQKWGRIEWLTFAAVVLDLVTIGIVISLHFDSRERRKDLGNQIAVSVVPAEADPHHSDVERS